jgi:hypothetical protein
MADFPHPGRPDPPHSGVLRSVYFLALAAVVFFTVLTAIIGFYDPPDGDGGIDLSPGFEDTGGSFQEDQNDRADYARNVALILTAVSAAVFAVGVLGLGSRFNPLRAGLVLGGLVIFLTGMGFWAASSDKWIGFLMSLINLGALGACALYLEEGLPVSPREPPRRLEPSDIAPPPPPPAPPAPPTDFEPSAPVPPPVEPPPARTEPPPPMSDLPRE